jgi:outer membrane protein TolC
MFALSCLLPFSAGAVPTDTLQVGAVVAEVLRNNQEIESALQQMFVMDAKVPQEGVLPPPEFIYMREGMPGFRYDEAMFERFELMQMIPFPTKLGTKSSIAEIVADHAHHAHLEKVYEVVSRAKMAYAELWYARRALELSRGNSDLLSQIVTAARDRYSVGSGGLQEILRAELELEKNRNQSIDFRQREQSMNAMLASLLNRPPGDTLGATVYPDSVLFDYTIEQLEGKALHTRAMLMHDSLMIEEKLAMRSMAKQEIIPDFRLGIQYMRGPMDEFRGWTITAGVTLPFAPWAVGAVTGKIEEAESEVIKANAAFTASKSMVASEIRGLVFKARGQATQLESYRRAILPRARQSLEAGIAGYRTGKTDFLMVLDSYRMVSDMTMESLMLRMEYEQTVARLEREVGVTDLSRLPRIKE